MEIVSPYRPGPAVSAAHKRLAGFDWIAALRSLAASAELACGWPTTALTCHGADLPVPSYEVATTSGPLMPWILEASLRFLESDRFIQDSALVSPDMLLFEALTRWRGADLVVLARHSPKYARRPLLNGVQIWAHTAKDSLVAFYREALALCLALPMANQIWGGDTEPLVRLLSPIRPGVHRRLGLRVAFVEHTDVLHELTHVEEIALARGEPIRWPDRPIVDFKYLRKRYLAAYFQATYGRRSV